MTSLPRRFTDLLLVMLSMTIVSCAAMGAEAGEEHAYGGLKTDLPFWAIIAFAGFVVALKFLGWDALMASLSSRETNENRLISEAEELRNQATERLNEQRGRMEAVDEEIREVLAEAERDADHTRGEIRQIADSEASAARTRVEVEIGRVKDQSLNEIFETLAEQVVQRSERKLRDGLSPADQEQLIESALGEFVAGAN